MTPPFDFKKDVGTAVMTPSRYRELFPHGDPHLFAYMRVAPDNPYAEIYRQMLQAQNPGHFYEDVPTKIDTWPQFEAMLEELQPQDTVVMIRLDHLAASVSLRLGLLRHLAKARVHIRLISNAASQSTPTAALADDILSSIDGRLIPERREGGDGGCGNGGP